MHIPWSGMQVAVAVAVLVPAMVGVAVAVAVVVAVAVGVSVGVSVTVPVSVGVFIAVAVAVGIGVEVAVSVGVLGGALVDVGVGIPIDVGVDEAVGVPNGQFGSSQLVPSANVSPTTHGPFVAALCTAATASVAPHETWMSRILNGIGTLALQCRHDERIKRVGRHLHAIRAADGDDDAYRIGKDGEREEHGDGDESGGWPSQPVHGEARQRNH